MGRSAISAAVALAACSWRLMEDNQGAIALAKNPVAHARTKHIDIRYHYDVKYCPTRENANLLTKPIYQLCDIVVRVYRIKTVTEINF